MPRKQPARDLTRLGRYIAAARRAHYGTVSAAVKAAGVNTMTWNKAEDGQPIREDRLTAIEKALGWAVGDGYVIAEGGEPLSTPTPGVRSSGASLSGVSNDDLVAELRRRLAESEGHASAAS